MMGPSAFGGAGGSDDNIGGRNEGTNSCRINTVNNDFEEEEFQFCIDQLFNGDHEQSRAALECLVEEPDEFSLYHIEGFVEVVNKKARDEQIIQLEQPSTSQANTFHQARKPKHEWKIITLINFREELEKNPAKRENVIQKIRTYHKERWERITEEEKESFRGRNREACRKYYSNLSAEKKRERYQKEYQRIKNDKKLIEKKRAKERQDYARKKSTGSNKHECKFADCGQSFIKKFDLTRHERIHLDIKPFSCAWPNCGYSAERRDTVTQHVRIKHFKLPKSKQQQKSLKIVDNRNHNDYIRVNNDLVDCHIESSNPF